MNEGTYIDDTHDPDAETGTRARFSGSVDDAAAPSTAASDVAREPGSVIAKRYVLKARLGRGRYGEVYEAVDRSLSDPALGQEHTVALHLLNARVMRRTRLLQKLEACYREPHLWSHSNAVSVRGFGCDRGQYFLVVDLLEGASLRTLLDRMHPELPSAADAFAVLRGVGDALEYAHTKGVVHGELRPDAVFITSDSKVRVLDLLPASLPRTETFFVEDTGPGGIAAPDPRDDVYGLACIAYELYAGKHPFGGSSPLEALTAGMSPAPIPGLGLARWSALRRGLELDRERRTPTVSALLAELGITGEPPAREPARPPERAAPPPQAPPPAVTAVGPRRGDDDLPVIGDFSEAWDDGWRRTEDPPMDAPPARPSSSESWRLDPADVRRYASRTGQRAPRRSIWPWVVGLLVLAGGGVLMYFNHEPIGAQFRAWFGAARTAATDAATAVTGGLPREGEETVAAPEIATVESEPETTASTTPSPSAAVPPREPQASRAEPSAAAPAPSAAAVPPAPAEEAVADATAEPLAADASAPGPPPVAEPAPAPSEPPLTEPAAVDTGPPAPARAAPEAEPVASAAAAAPAPRPAPPPAPPEPERFSFLSEVAFVSERDAGATIRIRRTGGTLGPSAVRWWTSPGTAVPGSDYADLGVVTERFAAGEATRSIYIPIVGDSNREPSESFYVNLATSAEPGAPREVAQRIEVVIEDDD